MFPCVLLIGWLREYANNRLNSRLMDERRTIPPHVVMDFGNQGLLGMVAPQEYGGLGLSNAQIVRVVQQLAAVDTTLASFTLVNNALGLRPILRYAKQELIDRLMPSLATGRELAAFAMTEAEAGSNIRNLSSVGRPDPAGGWRLYGTKLWSGTASWAGVVNTFVRLSGSEDGSEGVTGFVLETNKPGLRHGPEAMTMGLRAMVQNQVHLEGIHVTEAEMLGSLGQGMTPASDAMEYGRFAIAAMSLGVIKRCMQLMLRHAERRVVATGRLIDNPATTLRVSELSAASTAIEALVMTVAAQLDADTPPPIDMYCACKTLGPEYAWQAADGLIQQMAGRGYVETNIAPQILRDARILRIFEGPTEPMHAHIGARLAHMPGALTGYVAEQLSAPEIAKQIAGAAGEIWEHHQAHAERWGGAQAAKTQAHLKIGEVASFGLLMACLKAQTAQLELAATKRAQEWAALKFRRRYADALAVTPAQAALLDTRAIESLHAAIGDVIGDVEQSLAGPDDALDPILRQAPEGDARPEPLASAPAEPKPAPETASPEGPKAAVLAWLKDWMAAEYAVPVQSIGDTDRFAAYGMDSVAAMLLVSALEDWTGASLPATLVWDFRSLDALAAHVAARADVRIVQAPETRKAPEPLDILSRIDDMSEEELKRMIKDYSDADGSVS